MHFITIQTFHNLGKYYTLSLVLYLFFLQTNSCHIDRKLYINKLGPAAAAVVVIVKTDSNCCCSVGIMIEPSYTHTHIYICIYIIDLSIATSGSRYWYVKLQSGLSCKYMPEFFTHCSNHHSDSTPDHDMTFYIHELWNPCTHIIIQSMQHGMMLFNLPTYRVVWYFRTGWAHWDSWRF